MDIQKKTLLALKKVSAVCAACLVACSPGLAAIDLGAAAEKLDSGIVVVYGNDADRGAAEILFNVLDKEYGSGEGVSSDVHIFNKDGLLFGESIFGEDPRVDDSELEAFRDEILSSDRGDFEYSQELRFSDGEAPGVATIGRTDEQNFVIPQIYFGDGEHFRYILDFEAEMSYDDVGEFIGERMVLAGQEFVILDAEEGDVDGTTTLSKLKLVKSQESVILGEGDRHIITLENSGGETFKVELKLAAVGVGGDIGNGNSQGDYRLAIVDAKIVGDMNGVEQDRIDKANKNNAGVGIDAGDVHEFNIVGESLFVSVVEIIDSERDEVNGVAELIVGLEAITLEHDQEARIGEEDYSDKVGDNSLITFEITPGGADRTVEQMEIVYSNSDPLSLTVASGYGPGLGTQAYVEPLFGAFSLVANKITGEEGQESNPSFSFLECDDESCSIKFVDQFGYPIDFDFLAVHERTGKVYIPGANKDDVTYMYSLFPVVDIDFSTGEIMSLDIDHDGNADQPVCFGNGVDAFNEYLNLDYFDGEINGYEMDDSGDEAKTFADEYLFEYDSTGDEFCLLGIDFIEANGNRIVVGKEDKSEVIEFNGGNKKEERVEWIAVGSKDKGESDVDETTTEFETDHNEIPIQAFKYIDRILVVKLDLSDQNQKMVLGDRFTEFYMGGITGSDLTLTSITLSTASGASSTIISTVYLDVEGSPSSGENYKLGVNSMYDYNRNGGASYQVGRVTDNDDVRLGDGTELEVRGAATNVVVEETAPNGDQSVVIVTDSNGLNTQGAITVGGGIEGVDGLNVGGTVGGAINGFDGNGDVVVFDGGGSDEKFDEGSIINFGEEEVKSPLVQTNSPTNPSKSQFTTNSEKQSSSFTSSDISNLGGAVGGKAVGFNALTGSIGTLFNKDSSQKAISSPFFYHGVADLRPPQPGMRVLSKPLNIVKSDGVSSQMVSGVDVQIGKRLRESPVSLFLGGRMANQETKLMAETLRGFKKVIEENTAKVNIDEDINGIKIAVAGYEKEDTKIAANFVAERLKSGTLVEGTFKIEGKEIEVIFI